MAEGKKVMWYYRGECSLEGWYVDGRRERQVGT